jgi:DNA repair exonuclease SbcCD ATPase subunit
LNRAYLSYADFSDADLSGASLISADLTEVYFVDTKMKETKIGCNQGLSYAHRKKLEKREAIVMDMQEEPSKRLQKYEKIRRLEEARSDLAERVHDLENAYDRASDAFRRLTRYIERLVNSQKMKPNGLKAIQQEYDNIFACRIAKIEELNTYLDGLDEETFNPNDFLNRLRGIHYDIKKLSEYRSHYSQLWSESYKIPSHNTCELKPDRSETTGLIVGQR